MAQLVRLMRDKVFQRLDSDHRDVTGKNKHQRIFVFEKFSR